MEGFCAHLGHGVSQEAREGRLEDIRPARLILTLERGHRIKHDTRRRVGQVSGQQRERVTIDGEARALAQPALDQRVDTACG